MGNRLAKVVGNAFDNVLDNVVEQVLDNAFGQYVLDNALSAIAKLWDTVLGEAL